MMPPDDYCKQHVHRFSNSQVAVVSIHKPILVTIGQIFKFLHTMHLNSDPMHYIHYVFESIKYYGVFFVLLLALS